MSRRFVRFSDRKKETHYGLLDDQDGISVYSGPPWHGGAETGQTVKLTDTSLLAPVEHPEIPGSQERAFPGIRQPCLESPRALGRPLETHARAGAKECAEAQRGHCPQPKMGPSSP